MGSRFAPIPQAVMAAQSPLLRRFARLIHERYCGRLYLFGSRARGTASQDSDYDLVTVSRSFRGIPRFERLRGRRQLWRQAGGWGVALDLHCYTPEEFLRELRSLGYLNSALRRGELVEVKPQEAAPDREAVGS